MPVSLFQAKDCGGFPSVIVGNSASSSALLVLVVNAAKVHLLLLSAITIEPLRILENSSQSAAQSRASPFVILPVSEFSVYEPPVPHVTVPFFQLGKEPPPRQ